MADKFASRQFVKDDGVSNGEIFWDSKCDLRPTEIWWTWKVTGILNSLSISDARVLLPFVQMDSFLFAVRRGYHEGKKMWNSHQCCETLEGTLIWREILPFFSKPVRSRINLPLTFLWSSSGLGWKRNGQEAISPPQSSIFTWWDSALFLASQTSFLNLWLLFSPTLSRVYTQWLVD